MFGEKLVGLVERLLCLLPFMFYLIVSSVRESMLNSFVPLELCMDVWVIPQTLLGLLYCLCFDVVVELKNKKKGV